MAFSVMTYPISAVSPMQLSWQSRLIAMRVDRSFLGLMHQWFCGEHAGRDSPGGLSPGQSGLFRNVLTPFLSLSLLMRPQGLLFKTPTFQLGEDLFLKCRRVVLLKPHDHRSIKANRFLQRQTIVDAKPARGMREVFVGGHIGFEARSVEALVVEEIGAFAWLITGRKRQGSLMPVVISLTSGYSLTHP